MSEVLQVINSILWISVGALIIANLYSSHRLYKELNKRLDIANDTVRELSQDIITLQHQYNRLGQELHRLGYDTAQKEGEITDTGYNKYKKSPVDSWVNPRPGRK